jgi:MGT family glycosyltransferase
MARFLFCSYGAAGHVTPLWPVASALRARGHEVAVLTSAAYADRARSLGLRYFAPRAWQPTFEVQSRPPPRGGVAALRELRRALHEVMLPDALRQASDLASTLRAWDADVLVGTTSTFGVSLLAEKQRRPWATHAPMLTCPLPSRDLAPWGAGAPVPRGAPARARAALQRGAYGVLNGLLASEWGRLRAREGLPPGAPHLAESVSSPYLYTIPSPAEFDFPRADLPPHVHYVGPCLEAEPAGEHWSNPFGGRRPLVYCTAGTVADPRPLARAAVEAVRGEPVDLFITLGPHVPPSELGPLPPNVAVAPFVPQRLLLPHASAVLCNGGSGAVMGALAAGRPLIVAPQLSDQPENAARCAALGAAVVLPAHRASASALREALRAVLGRPSYAAAAARMAASLAALDGPAAAARLLVRLAKTGRPVHRDAPAAPPPASPRLAPAQPPTHDAPAVDPVSGVTTRSGVVRVDRGALRGEKKSARG